MSEHHQPMPLLSTGADYIMARRHLVDVSQASPVVEGWRYPRTRALCGVVGRPIEHPLGETFDSEHPVCRRCLKAQEATP